MATSQDFVNWVCSPAIDHRFLKYVLLAEKAAFLRFASGTTHQTIYFPEVKAFHVCLPPLPEQRAIAHILGTLDDKIELNRRMNETLEAMARALFKSWFVDFDPVRAKAEGRDPGLPPALADLFPSEFEDSELGEIPKGWRVGVVEDEFEVTMGQSPPGETYNNIGEGVPFYQGRADFTERFPRRRIYCTAPTRQAKSGDTLVSVRAPVGDINMAGEDCAIGRGVAAARHRSGSRSYTYQFMRSIAKVFAVFEGEGTVFGSIGKKDFNSLACVAPPAQLLAAFEAKAAPLDDRFELAAHESHTFAALRDTLLPKLISGELRVPDAERFVEAVL
jgi:type I restriction enzyme S subunit